MGCELGTGLMDERSEHERLVEVLQRVRDPEGAPSPEMREEMLRRLVRAAVPEARASEALRQRVRELALGYQPPQQRGGFFHLRPKRTRWAAAVVLVAAIAMVLVFRPVGATARLLRRIDLAITDARSAHEVTWRSVPAGRRIKDGETWYQKGRWRLESLRDRRLQIFANGRLWSYEKATNLVTVWRAEGPAGYNRTGFSPAAMARDFTRWGWRDRISVGGTFTRAGRRVRRVVIQSDKEPSRAVLLVDAATDLPIQIQTQRQTDGEWVTELITDCTFNAPLPERLFRPEFPATARVLDRDAERQRWERRLAKGIARHLVGKRTIVIRDLQVNAAGDVFLLYTAGRYAGDNGQDWSLDLTDSLGTRYWNGGLFQPFMEGSRLPGGAGLILNGEKLEGCWWVPGPRQAPWKPRRLTATFRIALLTHHRPDLGEPPVQGRGATASFTLAVSRPTASIVPGYMPYMAVPADEAAVLRTFAPVGRPR